MDREFLDNLIMLSSQEGLWSVFVWFAQYVNVVTKIV